MRRLARRLFTVCSAMSLVLCAAVCVLWARSYQQADSVHWFRYGGGFVTVTSSTGCIYVVWGHDNAPIIRGPYWFTVAETAFPPWESQWGVDDSRVAPVRWFQPQFDKRNPPAHVVMLSDWLLAVASLFLPAAWLLIRWRTRRPLGGR